MDNLQKLAQVIGYLIVIVGAAGGVAGALWLVWRGRDIERVVATYKEVIGLQEKKIALLEAELAELKRRNAELQLECDRLRSIADQEFQFKLRLQATVERLERRLSDLERER
ncbi:MAG: hypothetical protein IRY83_14990 [Chloroflexi bacterium]|nr:hypothetical protein [Chloroflexota bacterium]